MATKLAPIVPEAPGLFSMITGCPSAAERRGANRRAMTSPPPLGAKGTTSLSGLVGQAAWARATPGLRVASVVMVARVARVGRAAMAMPAVPDFRNARLCKGMPARIWLDAINVINPFNAINPINPINVNVKTNSIALY